MSIRNYFEIIRRHWIRLATFCLLGIVIAAVFALRTPAEYEASSSAYVTTQTASTPSDLSAASAFAAQAVVSYAKLGTTDYVLDGVISQLGLTTTPDALRKQVTVTADQNSVLLTIVARSTSPQAAASIANGVGSSLSTAVTTLNPQSANSNSQVKLTLVQRATAPASPSGPGLPFILALGLLGGLVVGVAITALAEQLNTRVTAPRDIQSLTGSPALGVLRLDRGLVRDPMVMLSAPWGPLAEEFRDLRNNLGFAMAERSARSVVITSCNEAEGKSTLIANLATAAGQAGLRVAVVDGDLRRAGLSNLLGLEDAPGLSQLLRGEAKADEVLRQAGGGTFAAVPAGSPVNNPNELLQAPKMAALVTVLTTKFDLILIDSPPMLSVSDAVALARVSGAAVLVAASGEVTGPQLTDARAILERSGVALLGTVVNMVPQRELHGQAGRYKQRYEPESLDRTSPRQAADLFESLR